MPAAKYSRYYTYIKPVIQNKTVKSFAPFIFSLISIMIFTVFAIRPTVSTILALRKNISDGKQVLTDLNTKTQSFSEAKRNYEGLSPEIKSKIEAAVPLQPNISSLVNSLQTASKDQASVSALQIQPMTIIDNTDSDAALQTPPNVGEITFTYNLQGSFNHLLLALYNLTQTPRLIDITSIAMHKQQPEEPLILSITGKAVFLK